MEVLMRPLFYVISIRFLPANFLSCNIAKALDLSGLLIQCSRHYIKTHKYETCVCIIGKKSLIL